MSRRRRDSLSTEADNSFYNQYSSRRDKSVPRSRRDNRLPLLSRTAGSLLSSIDRSKRQFIGASTRSLDTRDTTRSTSTVVSAKQLNFKREGYEQMNSRLGDDPLTAVRLMRAQMAQMSLKNQLNNRHVKSIFAREASQTLRKAEHEIERLQRQRTDAIVNGDTLDARRITREMKDLRARATYDAYADLLLSRQQLSSLGIHSKYIPQRDRRRTRRNDAYSPKLRNYSSDEERRRDIDVSGDQSRRSTSYESRLFNRYIYTPPNIESKARGYRQNRQATSRSFRSQNTLSPADPRRRLNRREGHTRERVVVKKNKRLADMKFLKPKTPPPKPPKTPPTDVPPTPENGEPGVCLQCYERNPALMNEEGLKTHWGGFCPCLTKCQFCDQVLHVMDLNNHQVNDCQFVGGTLKPCPRCGLAQYLGNPDHPNCNLKAPSSGGAWCPLCSKLVKPFSSKNAWRKHLIDECYNNPRNIRRWNGRYALSNGASLLGNLNQQPIEVLTSLAPTSQALATNESQLNGAVTRPQVRVNNLPVVQPNALISNQLRDAYNKLRVERRDDYIKQQQLDAAAEAEKEAEVV